MQRKKYHSKELNKQKNSTNSLLSFEDDIWHTSHGRNLDFTSIEIPWLKIALKRFMKISFVKDAKSTTASRFKAVQIFSEFLVEEFGFLSPQEITREVIIEYLNYLVDCNYKPSTRHQRLCLLRGFLELCVTEGWADIYPYILTPQDYPKATKAIPQFIPDEVIDQIIKNLEKLPRRIAAMLLVLMECGMRGSELCN